MNLLKLHHIICTLRICGHALSVSAKHFHSTSYLSTVPASVCQSCDTSAEITCSATFLISTIWLCRAFLPFVLPLIHHNRKLRFHLFGHSQMGMEWRCYPSLNRNERSKQTRRHAFGNLAKVLRHSGNETTLECFWFLEYDYYSQICR